MIINETTNYTESIEFLLAMRRTVSNEITSMSHLSGSQKLKFKNFLLNEATDYEILHFAMTNVFPEDKQNKHNELYLFSKLKEHFLINYESLASILKPEEITTFIESVGPIYPKLSTALPVLEQYLSEEPRQYWGPQDKEDSRDVVTKAGETVARGARAVKRSIFGGDAEGAGRGSATPGLVGHAKQAGQYVAKKGEDAYEAGKSHVRSIDARLSNLGKPAQSGGASGDRELQGGGSAETDNISTAHNAYEKTRDFLGSHGPTILAATALAGMAAYGAAKVYKRFFSQAAKSCAGKSGPAKDACMKQFKAKALQAKIQSLMKSKATCKKAKNPQKCMTAIDAEIQKARK
jgi:hypothetical protein